MPEIYGNVTGLGPHAHKALERIYRRRVPLDRIATPELVRSLVEASRETKRQVGALVHRSGAVDYVVVGTATGLMLPDIGRLRAAEGRFRALRLVHTHLYGESLTRDDLTDLTRLRLDLVSAIILDAEGEPRSMAWAYNRPTPQGDPNVPTRDDGRAYEIVGPVPYGHPQPDFGALIASLEQEFQGRGRTRAVRAKDGRAILIHVGVRKQAGAVARAQSSLAELHALAETAGVDVADTVVQLRDQIDPKFVVGRGKLEDVILRAIDLDAETLIFDQDLSPSQASGIAAHTDLKVIDRTQLILDIFAQRAESSDGKLQVELAQLKYALPRLGQKDDSLSRLTGGIGGRGPGETKLEIGRRRARERVTRLERELKQLAKRRTEQRRRRSSGTVPIVALVGYTNAGKSTLLNALTGADVFAENKLFATLDTRARRLHLPDNSFAVATDTVGFIRNMPKELFTAFRATFEEIADADLLLEVVDASNWEREDHERTTELLLEELGLERIPRLRVYNKADLLPDAERALLGAETGAITTSAMDRASVKRLVEQIAVRLRRTAPSFAPSADA
ncbi:MAG TPA: GTPase HflX [Polyangiaceae bacterium]